MFSIRTTSADGDKPAWFWQMQPSGGIPVAMLDGQVIRESNDIMMAIEEAFPASPEGPYKRMLPDATSEPEQASRVRPLLALEREVFSAWFRWLGSSDDAGSRARLEALLARVDAELGATAGAFFLGEEVTLVDCMFAPFLERMAASLPYYKGVALRRNEAYPHLEAWFVGMEGRPAYRHIASDFYTHVHDLPPQVGGCRSTASASAYADAIDGADGSWSWPLADDEAHDAALRVGLQPLGPLGQDAGAARREAAERLLANHEAVVSFAARGLGGRGLPPVSAPLSDPNARPPEEALPLVDGALRHVVHAMLRGTEEASPPLAEAKLAPAAAASALGYLRDRISVPRDMGYPAARQLRAHLNWAIEQAGKADDDRASAA